MTTKKQLVTTKMVKKKVYFGWKKHGLKIQNFNFIDIRADTITFFLTTTFFAKFMNNLKFSIKKVYFFDLYKKSIKV